MKKTILIVTTPGDAHSDVVAAFLRRNGHEPRFLYPESMFSEGGTTFRMDGKERRVTFGQTWNEVPIDLDEVRAVYWRKPFEPEMPESLPEWERSLAQREAQQALDAIWKLLTHRDDVYWMSDPAAIRGASNKLEQLHRAALLGFETPATLVTNQPDEAEKFRIESGGAIIYKTMAGQLPGQPMEFVNGTGKLLLTSLVEESIGAEAAIGVAPCMFQEHITKDRELRVTVFEDQVFTCALHSQEDPRSRIDWRHQNADFSYTAEKLPEDVSLNCVEMVRSYGLNYGALDFIVTPDGRYVFLELNPNGQWMFVQMKVPELALTQTLTDILVRNA